ncbi:hypothetical protein C5Y96_09910 [Blastopirellula marina]|uniref:Uncharacterized protein n=1 Tax=Blastopirellula marina TaxID=124 RepID=A0A2S8FLV9_9BACT|nr:MULTISPECIES: hypothetical protein [Pirellulaceae]PQO33165.1 hypothetical protein C5Y96_09910 [Blastopirellula marina]RCS52254.1 hypothetical protein DTL36_09920 [Bremerella cremea]
MSDSQDPNEEIPPEIRRAARKLQYFLKTMNTIYSPILAAQRQMGLFDVAAQAMAATRSIEQAHFRIMSQVLDVVPSMQKVQSSLISEVFDKTAMVEILRQQEELLSLFSSITSGPFANISSILDEARITLGDLDLTAIPTIDELTEEELSDPEVQDVLEKSKKGMSLGEAVNWKNATKNPYVQGILIGVISDNVTDILKRVILFICSVLFSSPDTLPPDEMTAIKEQVEVQRVTEGYDTPFQHCSANTATVHRTRKRKSKVVAVLLKKDVVFVNEKRGNKCLVSWFDEEQGCTLCGWIKSKYLKPIRVTFKDIQRD